MSQGTYILLQDIHISYTLCFNTAVMSALKGLQDKIKQLEIERTAAESNLKNLADETTQYRDMLDTTNPLGRGGKVC